MSGSFADDGGVNFKERTLIVEFIDNDGNAVGDLVVCGAEYLFADYLRCDLTLGLVGGDIVVEIVHTLAQISLAFVKYDVHSLFLCGRDGDYRIELMHRRIKLYRFGHLLRVGAVKFIDNEQRGHSRLSDPLDDTLLYGAYFRLCFDNEYAGINVAHGVVCALYHKIAQLGLGIVQTGRVHKYVLVLALCKYSDDSVSCGLRL